MTVSERDLQSAVIGLARRLGWRVMHLHDSRRQVSGGRVIGDKDAKGWPDLTLVHPGRGRILFRELKSAKGRLTPEQTSWLDTLQACGLDAAVWRPADWPDRITADLHGSPR